MLICMSTYFNKLKSLIAKYKMQLQPVLSEETPLKGGNSRKTDLHGTIFAYMQLPHAILTAHAARIMKKSYTVYMI